MITFNIIAVVLSTAALLLHLVPKSKKPEPVKEPEIWAVNTDWNVMQIHNPYAIDGRFIMYIGSKSDCDAYAIIMKPKDI